MERAETMITVDFFTGETLAEAIATDPDLAGGTPVL